MLLRLRPLFRWLVRLRSSPKAIAGGLALGTFLAMTPTVGIQIVLALFLATVINVNRGATIPPLWISNPLTVAPIYTLNYWLGAKFIGGPPVAEVSSLLVSFSKTLARLDLWDMKEQFYSILHMGKEILLPLLLGSCITGCIAAVLVYAASLRLLRVLLRKRARRHRLDEGKRKR